MAKPKRIAIVTSGGDAPGMNAAIRSVFRCVKTSNPRNEIILFKNGFRGLAGRLEANMDVNVQRTELRGILNRGGTFIGTGRVPELLPVDPEAPDAERRLKAREAFLSVASVNLFQHQVDGLVVIGGDGSYQGAYSIAQAYRERFDRPLRVVGIPATIDNDIFGTDYTIGYDTALGNTVEALRKIRDTVASHRRAIILEVMGNTSGWIALGAGIAAGASAILLPEIADTYNQESIINRCISALRHDYRYFIVVMAEGVKKASGDPEYATKLADAIQNNEEIEQLLGHPMSVRNNIIGHMTRGGPPSARDNIMAARFGLAASLAALGEVDLPEHWAHDVSVALHGSEVTHIPLREAVVNGPRLIQPGDDMYRLSHSLAVREDQFF